MKFPTQRRKTSGENLVPLINVVFLILIFFLAASIIRPFSDKEIELAKTADKTLAPNLRRLIFVGEDGPMLQQGVVAAQSELNDAVQSWLGEKEKPVTVVGDHRLAATQVLDVVETLRRAGIENINLLAQKGR